MCMYTHVYLCVSISLHAHTYLYIYINIFHFTKQGLAKPTSKEVTEGGFESRSAWLQGAELMPVGSQVKVCAQHVTGPQVASPVSWTEADGPLHAAKTVRDKLQHALHYETLQSQISK